MVAIRYWLQQIKYLLCFDIKLDIGVFNIWWKQKIYAIFIYQSILKYKLVVLFITIKFNFSIKLYIYRFKKKMLVTAVIYIWVKFFVAHQDVAFNNTWDCFVLW